MGQYSQSRLGLQSGLQGGHQVGLQGGPQKILQVVLYVVESFQMDSGKGNMGQELSDFKTILHLTTQKLKVI